ncbi:MAG: hypothetical protein AAGK17_13500 [Pseudomonadota bacterium]
MMGGKLSNWISFSGSQNDLAEIYERQGMPASQSFSAARTLLFTQLIEGTLKAKPADNSTWFAVLRNEGHENSLGLNEDSTIPTWFWWHFEETRLSLEKQMPWAEGSRDSASVFGNSFELYQTKGIKDGGILEASVEDVVLERAAIRGLPRRRGERQSKFADQDEKEVLKAITDIENGKTRAETIKYRAKNLEGASYEAKVRRLRNRLRSLGY